MFSFPSTSTGIGPSTDSEQHHLWLIVLRLWATLTATTAVQAWWSMESVAIQLGYKGAMGDCAVRLAKAELRVPTDLPSSTGSVG